MRDLLSNVELAKPLLLWLLLAIPLLWFRLRDRRLVIVIWRTLILCLLILSLADPQHVTQQSTREERIFAYDFSDSIPTSMRSWMDETTQRSFSSNPKDRAFVFGSETREVPNWRRSLRGEDLQLAAIKPEKTNIEKLVTALLALPAAPRSLFLFTDGWETQGSVERLLPAITGTGLKIYPIVPAKIPEIANIAVTKLVAPTLGKTGELVNLKVVVENQNGRTVQGTLNLTSNGRPFKSETINLQPGSQIYTYQTPLPDESPAAYRATFTARQPSSDVYTGDNHALAWITIKTKVKVLLLNGQRRGGRYLEEIFKRLGFDVTSRSADMAPSPTGYAVVIFNDVEREKLSTSYLAAVERHVALGNGFLILGGEASFTPGSFRGTPIENLLPVEPKEPPREERNRAVVLIIDKSGSMREDNRLDYAKEAAKAVARQLKDNDHLGIVGFDVSPFVVVYLEAVGRLRGIIDAQIDRLKPGGQTFFLPALIEAKRQLDRSGAPRKHVILLSDGETRGSQGELVDAVRVMKNEMKITVSAVAIGSEADIRIMKRISQYGGGLFHHTTDPTNLPRIVLEQLQDKPKDEPQAPKELMPVQERASEMLAGFSIRAYPTLRGYMESELKRGALLDLAIPQEDRKAPLMASWRYGQGKAAALTTDLEGNWSRNWVQWSGLQSFWGKVLDWLRPSEESIPLHEVRVGLAENQPILDLFVYEQDSGNSRFVYGLHGNGGKTDGALKKLALGHFQATLPISAPGDYRIEIVEERGDRRVTYPPVGYSLPYDLGRERPRLEVNYQLLARLAQASGGEINPKSEEAINKQTVTKELKAMRPPLIMLAFGLFLLEIATRKLLLSEDD